MTLIITKADFTPANLVKFSQNIKEDQIEPYINAAQDYDLQPRLDPILYADIIGVIEGATGRPELTAFINTKVKRYLVLTAYYRFIAQHGINVTQFGVSSTRDPQGTFDQVSAQDRAVVLRQVASDINIALIKMTSLDFVFDGIEYGKTNKGANQNQMIRAPKRKRLNVANNELYLDSYLNIIK